MLDSETARRATDDHETEIAHRLDIAVPGRGGEPTHRLRFVEGNAGRESEFAVEQLHHKVAFPFVSRRLIAALLY
jgi:hypothetical protein